MARKPHELIELRTGPDQTGRRSIAPLSVGTRLDCGNEQHPGPVEMGEPHNGRESFGHGGGHELEGRTRRLSPGERRWPPCPLQPRPLNYRLTPVDAPPEVRGRRAAGQGSGCPPSGLVRLLGATGYPGDLDRVPLHQRIGYPITVEDLEVRRGVVTRWSPGSK